MTQDPSGSQHYQAPCPDPTLQGWESTGRPFLCLATWGKSPRGVGEDGWGG